MTTSTANAAGLAPQAPVPDEIISGWRGITKEIPKSRAQLWRDIKDGLFPEPIELGPNKIGWLRSEIERWKAGRPRRRYSGLSGRPLHPTVP